MKNKIKELLDQWFKPLSWYSEWMGLSNLKVSQPLWQYRRRYMELYQVKEQIQRICANLAEEDIDEETKQLFFITDGVLQIHENPFIDSGELFEKLLALANDYAKQKDHNFYRYSVSLLTTLLARQSQTSPLAIGLLQMHKLKKKTVLLIQNTTTFNFSGQHQKIDISPLTHEKHKGIL